MLGLDVHSVSDGGPCKVDGEGHKEVLKLLAPLPIVLAGSW